MLCRLQPAASRWQRHQTLLGACVKCAAAQTDTSSAALVGRQTPAHAAFGWSVLSFLKITELMELVFKRVFCDYTMFLFFFFFLFCLCIKQFLAAFNCRCTKTLNQIPGV